MRGPRHSMHRVACQVGLLIALASDAVAQTSSWSDAYLAQHPFAMPYWRSLAHSAATTLLSHDPLCVDAVGLFVRANDVENAIALAERIAQARPAVLLAAVDAIQGVFVPELAEPWNAPSVSWATRLRVLQARLARGRVPPSPDAQSGCLRVAESQPDAERRRADADDQPDDERLLRDATEHLEQARDRLDKRRSWSPRVVASAMGPSHRLLQGLAARSQGPAGQAALMKLGDSEFEAGQLAEARATFHRFVARHPTSDLAWVAALRAAQLTQALDHPADAAEEFTRIAVQYAAAPTVSMMATFYAAGAYEADARWDDARDAYQRVLSLWPGRHEVTLAAFPTDHTDTCDGLDWPVRYFGDAFRSSQWPVYIRRADVATRVTELASAMGDPLGRTVLRARWLLDHHRPSAARAILEDVSGKHSAATETDVRTLTHRAEFDEAVAAISRRGRLPRHARRALWRLCQAQLDGWVGAACAVHASDLAVMGRAAEARALLQRTLQVWARAHATARPESDDPVTNDVWRIRDLVLESLARRQRLDGAGASRPPFVITTASLIVALDEHDERPVAKRPSTGRDNVVFLAAPESRALWAAVERLSACEQRRITRLARLWTAMIGYPQTFCVVGERGGPADVWEIRFATTDRREAFAIGSPGQGGVAIRFVKDGDDWSETDIVSSWEY